MKKLFSFIFLSCYFFFACNKEEESSFKSYQNSKLIKIEKYKNDSLYEIWNYRYNTDNMLTGIYDINGEKLLTLQKINDTIIELLYFWKEGLNDNMGCLRAKILDNKLIKLYEFNKVDNEEKEEKYVFNYSSNSLTSVKFNDINDFYFYLDVIRHSKFQFIDNNLTQFQTNFKQYYPFGGAEKFDSINCKIKYTSYPFSKFIPDQNVLGYPKINLRNYPILFDPIYILGINNIESIPISKNLIEEYENLSGFGYKDIFNLNYEFHNDTVQRMYVYGNNYWKLIWE